MVTRCFLLVVVTLGATVLLGCEKKDGLYSHEEHPWGARLSRADALAAALKAPEIRRSSLSECDAPTIAFYKPRREWVVGVVCRPNAPGMDFMILVDDASGRTTFVPGA